MRAWIHLLVAILSEVTGSLALKGALDRPLLYVVVVACYVGSFASLYVALRHDLPLGVGYGIWGASGVALTAVMSRAVYAEPITVTMAVGIGVVMAGIVVVEIGSQSAQKARLPS